MFKSLKKISSWSEQEVLLLIDLYKERVKTLRELADQLLLLHDGPQEFDQKALKKWTTPETAIHLEKLIDLLNTTKPFTEQSLADAIKALCSDLGIKLVALAQPIRIALTGTSASPGIFALLAIMGKEESVSRIAALREYLSS